MEAETEKVLSSVLDAVDVHRVLSVSPEGEGDTVAVTLLGRDGEELRLHILVEQYAELGVRVGTLSPSEAEALREAGRLCHAIRRGLALLQYGAPSSRRLADKLVARGVSRDTAAEAVAYLAERGYIREDHTARLRAEQGVRKLWGPRRIREDLRAHGFSPEAVEEALEELSEVDWEENCAAAIRKKYRVIPEDRQERQKLMAAILRLGYDSETVRDAVRMILKQS